MKRSFLCDHSNSFHFFQIRSWVGDSTFGMSGVRDNCFSPNGSLCQPEVDPDTIRTYESSEVVDIPDNSSAGVESVIEVPDELNIGSLSLDLNLTHTISGSS